MNTPIQTLYLWLQSEGLFGDWTAPDGSIQPAPTVQMRLFDEKDIPTNERILLIRNSSSGGGTRYVSTPLFSFAIMGKAGESAVFAETYAELIYSALLDFENADCIISIDPMGRIGGAYKSESGRAVYDMEFSVNVDSGHFGAGKT